MLRAGIPAQGLLVVFSAIETALANPAIFAQFIPLQKELVLSIDGPDTVVDLA
jgi:hypothetical protein